MFRIVDAKRQIESRFDEAGVQRHMKHWPFKVISKEGKPIKIVLYLDIFFMCFVFYRCQTSDRTSFRRSRSPERHEAHCRQSHQRRRQTYNNSAISWYIFHVFCILDAKRLIGRRFDEAGVQSDMKHWPFKVISEEGKPKIEVEFKGEFKKFYPEEVSSMVLLKMKETAEAYLGKVSITVN